MLLLVSDANILIDIDVGGLLAPRQILACLEQLVSAENQDPTHPGERSCAPGRDGIPSEGNGRIVCLLWQGAFSNTVYFQERGTFGGLPAGIRIVPAGTYEQGVLLFGQVFW